MYTAALAEGKVKVTNTDNGQVTWINGGFPTAVQVDGGEVAVTQQDGGIWVYDIATQTQIRQI